MKLTIAAALTLLLGLAVAGPASAERIYSKAEAQALLEKLLLENIVPFWYPGVIDERHGGYRLNHDAEGRWRGPADKVLVTQARTVWFFSRLHNSPYGQPEHLEAAHHGFRFLKDKMWDPEHGGFYWSVSHDGSAPVESQKHMYGEGFGLYALAEHIRVSKAPEAVELAKELFALMEEKAHDDMYGATWSGSPATGATTRATCPWWRRAWGGRGIPAGS
jgi:mannobiose 2-epimerase